MLVISNFSWCQLMMVLIAGETVVVEHYLTGIVANINWCQLISGLSVDYVGGKFEHVLSIQFGIQ